MALVGVELEMLVNEQDALTARPPPCALYFLCSIHQHLNNYFDKKLLAQSRSFLFHGD